MKNKSLDLAENEFKELLKKSNDLIIKEYRHADTKKAYHDFPQAEVESWFAEKLPHEGMDNTVLLNEIEKKVLNTATNNLGRICMLMLWLVETKFQPLLSC